MPKMTLTAARKGNRGSGQQTGVRERGSDHSVPQGERPCRDPSDLVPGDSRQDRRPLVAGKGQEGAQGKRGNPLGEGEEGPRSLRDEEVRDRLQTVREKRFRAVAEKGEAVRVRADRFSG